MKKYFNIIPILVIIFVGMMSCDNKIGKPDIRKEHTEGDKPDYFGWKWNFKW